MKTMQCDCGYVAKGNTDGEAQKIMDDHVSAMHPDRKKK